MNSKPRHSEPSADVPIDEIQTDSLPDDLTLDYDALIFDCDGTLSHSMPLHYVAWRETMASYGIEFRENRFYQMGGMPSEQIIEILSGEQGVQVDADEASAKKEQAFVDRIGQLMAVETICNLAQSYHGRLPMAVASGGIRPVVRMQLDHLGLTDLFPVLVTAEDTQRHKPEPDVFLEAARQLGIRADRCLVFEDSPLGFRAARSAAMGVIDVRPFHPN